MHIISLHKKEYNDFFLIFLYFDYFNIQIWADINIIHKKCTQKKFILSKSS